MEAFWQNIRNNLQ